MSARELTEWELYFELVADEAEYRRLGHNDEEIAVLVAPDDDVLFEDEETDEEEDDG